jgi:large subunit ribosomal protein L21
MYAIVKVGGKQYRVEEGDSLVVDRLHQDEGASVALEPLLLASDKTLFERSDLEKVKVQAVVTGHERGKKLRVLKFKPKRGYKRTTGHRSELTRLEIKEIRALTRKPAAKKDGAEKPAAKKPAERKPAAQKAETAAKRPAAKKPAKKKQPAKKPSAKSAGGKRAPAKKEKSDGS